MFNEIILLRPYFHSLREIGAQISLDIKLPVTWKFDTIIDEYKSIKLKVADKDIKNVLISLVTTSTEEGYSNAFNCAKDIITLNVELEEKRKLFHETVKELEQIFLHSSLDKLKELTLIKNDEQKSTNGQENTVGTGLAGKGTGERPDGNKKS